VHLEGLAARRITLLTTQRKVNFLATKAARAAHLGPRAGAHEMASPAMYTCCLSWKAALRSEAAVAAMMTAHVSCGGVPGLLGDLGSC
jgi:hypothetical protein